MLWFGSDKLSLLNKFPNERIFFLDIITTGYTPAISSVLQVAVIDGTGRVLLNTYVKPDRKLNYDKVEDRFGIPADKLEDAPEWDIVRAEMQKVLSHAGIVAGENIDRKLQLLKSKGFSGSASNKTFDVTNEYRHYMGLSRDTILEDCADHYGISYLPDNAYYGAGTAMQCFHALMNDASYAGGESSPAEENTEPAKEDYREPERRSQESQSSERSGRKRRAPRLPRAPRAPRSNTGNTIYRIIYFILMIVFWWLISHVAAPMSDPNLGYILEIAFLTAAIHCLIRVFIPRGFHWIPWLLLVIAIVIEVEQFRGYPSTIVQSMSTMFPFLNQYFSVLDLAGSAIGLVINLILQRIDRDAAAGEQKL